MKQILFILAAFLTLTSYSHGRRQENEHFAKKVRFPLREKKFLYPYPLHTLNIKDTLDPGPSQLTNNEAAEAHIRKARRTGDLTQYKQAETYALKSMIERESTTARLILSEVAQADHRFKEGLEWIRGIDGDPTASSLRVRIFLGMGKLDQAEKEAKTLVRILPLMTSYIHLGTVYEAKKNYQKAMETYYKALDKEDVQEALPSAWVRSLMARLYLRNGERAHAQKLIQEALKIVPTYPLAKALNHGQ